MYGKEHFMKDIEAAYQENRLEILAEARMEFAGVVGEEYYEPDEYVFDERDWA